MSSESQRPPFKLMDKKHFLVATIAAASISLFVNGAKYDLTHVDLYVYMGITTGFAMGLIAFPSLIAGTLTVPFWLIGKKSIKSGFTIVFWTIFALAVLSQVALLVM